MPPAFNAVYLASGMKRNAFLPRGFGDAGDRNERVRAAATRRVSPELLAVLRAQNEALPPSEARLRHLQLLSTPGAAVVATGQQVGLFLGPLYTVFKAASAVAIARALTAETGVPCVPLFWLQTEDHDFAEIATSVSPLDGQEPLRLRLVDDPALSRRSVGDRALGADVTALINDLEPALSGLPANEEVIELLRAEYRPGVSPGRAFAGVLGRLFAEDGLIVFDPRCATASRLAAPILRRALVDSTQIDALLTGRGQALRDAGFTEQIEPRPGSPLAFFHLEENVGPRYRLACRDASYAVLGAASTVTQRDLLSIQEREPLRFSTSALLRPIFQDTLFPTAVYVGGPAEVNYFAQLGPVYEAFGLEMPLVVERAHFRLVTPRIRGLLAKLGLTTSELDQPRDVLVRRLSTTTVAANETPSLSWTAELEQRLDSVRARASDLDPALVRATERTRESVRRAVERFARRYERAMLDRDQVLATRLARLDGWLRPDGHLQERVFSFPAFAARVGLAEFRRLILAAVDPFNPTMREIDL